MNSILYAKRKHWKNQKPFNNRTTENGWDTEVSTVVLRFSVNQSPKKTIKYLVHD